MRVPILSLLLGTWGCAAQKYDWRATKTRATEDGNFPGYVEKWHEDKRVLSISGRCRIEGFLSQAEAEKRLKAQKDALAADWQDKLSAVCGGRGYQLQHLYTETKSCPDGDKHPSGRNIVQDTAYFKVVCE